MLKDYPLNILLEDIANLPANRQKYDLQRLFSCIDNTTLKSTDNELTITEFCQKTLSMLCLEKRVGHVASVCVYPQYVSLAKRLLAGSTIRIASVAGEFPSGKSPLEIKLSEVKNVLENGADEIDFVIDRGNITSGRLTDVGKEVLAVKGLCKETTLKVIIECCDIADTEMIYDTATAVMEAGTDFVKTSTGFGSGGATTENAWAILSAIRDYHKKTKKTVGFKAAGGIRDQAQALLYYRMAGKMVYGENISNQCFRIGASRLTEVMFKNLTV